MGELGTYSDASEKQTSDGANGALCELKIHRM